MAIFQKYCIRIFGLNICLFKWYLTKKRRYFLIIKFCHYFWTSLWLGIIHNNVLQQSYVISQGSLLVENMCKQYIYIYIYKEQKHSSSSRANGKITQTVLITVQNALESAYVYRVYIVSHVNIEKNNIHDASIFLKAFLPSCNLTLNLCK